MFMKLTDDAIMTLQCRKPCDITEPTKGEIDDMCNKRGVPDSAREMVHRIFSNIDSGTRGGAAEEPSSSNNSYSSSNVSISTDEDSFSPTTDEDSLSPSDYVSKGGYTQTEQNLIVDSIVALLILLGGTAGVVGSTLTLHHGEKFLIERAILTPICKGGVDRVIRAAVHDWDPIFAGPTCSESLAKTEGLLAYIWGIIGVGWAKITWSNFNAVHAHLKDRLFEPIKAQKKHTLKARAKRRKDRTRRRERKASKAAKKKAKAEKRRRQSKSRKSRRSRRLSPNGPSGSMSLTDKKKTSSKSSSKSRSKSSSKSRSKSRSKSSSR